MPTIQLTFACGLYDRMLALYTGEVKPKDIDLKFVTVDHPRLIFDRQAAVPEYDVSELSASEYITGVANGDRRFVAIPVFPSRLFRHGFITVNRNSVKLPSDLCRKRIGVQLYTMTAAVWIRGLLQQDYGVDLSTVEWVEGSLTSSEAYGKPSRLPNNSLVKITANDSGKTLDQLLVDGDIDAIIGAEVPPSLGKLPHIQRLFPDYKAVEKDYYSRTGIFPIMHTIVIKREIYDKNPLVSTALFTALNESKNIALGKMRFLSTLRYMLPWLACDLEEVAEVFGEDPWPYGIEENRKTLEALIEFLSTQGLLSKQVSLEDLFVPCAEATE